MSLVRKILSEDSFRLRESPTILTEEDIFRLQDKISKVYQVHECPNEDLMKDVQHIITQLWRGSKENFGHKVRVKELEMANKSLRNKTRPPIEKVKQAKVFKTPSHVPKPIVISEDGKNPHVDLILMKRIYERQVTQLTTINSEQKKLLDQVRKEVSQLRRLYSVNSVLFPPVSSVFPPSPTRDHLYRDQLRPRRGDTDDRRYFACPQEGCCRRFTTARYLERHSKTHVPDRQFQRMVKGYALRFTRKQTRLNHGVCT